VLFLFSAHVAAEFDRADDGARAEQWDHVRGDAAAVVRKGHKKTGLIAQPGLGYQELVLQ
jgi:hypothetical protein